MLPERFGRYEVLAEIGDGAMGRVYSAWDPRVSRVVAVKTIKAELLTSDTAADYLKRFRREAVAAGGLNHPQVVRVFDIGDDFLVMELVEGRTLRALIRDRGRLEPQETLRLLGPVADAIDHAHKAGIVHRDIKPANLIVQPDGQPKLMDFGVAHLAASVLTTAGQVLGSPSYMAPEQIAGLELTGRADVYSLAVVAYEMLTGQPPFSGQTITQVIYRVMHEAPPPPRQWNAALPARYDDVFARGLAKDPAARFATAGELVAALDLREIEHALAPALESVGGSHGPHADDVPTLVSDAPRQQPAHGSRSRVPALLAAAGAFALGALGWAAMRPGQGAATPAAEASPAVPAAQPPVRPAPQPFVTISAVASPAAVRAVSAPRRHERTTAAVTPDEPAPAVAPAPELVVEGQLVDLAGDVSLPVRVSGGPAPYPERARARREQGTVAVQMIVDESGVPTELVVSESAGPVLDAAVLEAVRAWRFEPARKNGVKVKVRWTARQTYRSARR